MQFKAVPLEQVHQPFVLLEYRDINVSHLFVGSHAHNHLDEILAQFCIMGVNLECSHFQVLAFRQFGTYILNDSFLNFKIEKSLQFTIVFFLDVSFAVALALEPLLKSVIIFLQTCEERIFQIDLFELYFFHDI